MIMKSCYKSFYYSYNNIVYEYDISIICYLGDKQNSDNKFLDIFFSDI